MKYTNNFSDETDYKIMMGHVNFVIQDKIKHVLEEVQKARDYFKIPFVITSGYRTFEYNQKVGGAVTSQHVKGEAVDFMANGNLFVIFEWITRNLDYDQVIFESKNGTNWIHFSRKKEGNRKQALIAVWNKTKFDYVPFDKK